MGVGAVGGPVTSPKMVTIGFYQEYRNLVKTARNGDFFFVLERKNNTK